MNHQQWEKHVRGLGAFAALCVFVLSITACQRSLRQEPTVEPRVEKLSERLKIQERELEELRHQNLVLKSQLSHKKRSPDFVEKREVAARTRWEAVRSERAHYALVIQIFRFNDGIGLAYVRDRFLSAYPVSVLADNVLYLSGTLLLREGQHGAAIKQFDRLIRSYPRGDKKVSAMFAKGLCYKRLNLKGQALKMFKDVLQSYPGSRESLRAPDEIKIVENGLKNAETL